MIAAVKSVRPTKKNGWKWPLVRWASRCCERILPDVPLSVEALMQSAERFTGLSDWGEFPFEEGLGAILDSCREDLQLKYLGRVLLRKGLLQTLVNRLCTQAAWKEDSSIAQRVIRRPFVVLGLPRTGTTLLHNLLSLDQACRPLLGWEAFYPVPIRKHGRLIADRRKAECERNDWMFRRFLPQVAVAHDFAPNGPEECAWLLTNSYLPPTLLDVGQQIYREWQASVSDDYLVGAYRLHQRQLQILQGTDTQHRWALKAPTHLYGLHGLTTVYPDAVAIQTHRDPNAVVGSSASLISRGMPDDSPRRACLGEEILRSLEVSWNRGMAVRKRLPPGRVIDVRYDDLVNRPMEVLQRIYASAGETFPVDLEQRVSSWLADHPQHARGKHVYSLEQFGLTTDEVEARLGQSVREFL